MVEQTFAMGAVGAVGLGGLTVSNALHDRGWSTSTSRSLASAIGGCAFLLAVLLLDVWLAVALATAMALLVLGLRIGYRRGLRGSSGKRSGQAWAEVTYAAGGAVSLAIGWGLLGDRWLAFLPIAFVAWGDNLAGLTRATLWNGRMGSIWPSMAMLIVGLAAALVHEHYWVGAVGAVVATVAERRRPNLGAIWDDNLNVVAASLGTMAVLVLLAG